MKKRQYHINPETGVPSLCRATKGKCPYGGESGGSNHFDTFSEAQEYSQTVFSQRYNVLPTSAGGEFLSELEDKKRVKLEKLETLMRMGDYSKLRTLSETKDMDLVMGVIEGEVESDGWKLTGAALQNVNLPRLFLQDMVIDYPDEFEDEARKWAASNRSLTHDDLVHILENDKNEDVKTVALFNENMDRDYIDDLIASKSESALMEKPYAVVFLDWKNDDSDVINDARERLKNNDEFKEKRKGTRKTINKYVNATERKYLTGRR